MDIANLQIKVDSRQLRTADKDLNNFQKASKSAANAVKSFAVAYAGISSVRSIARLSDEFTEIQTKIKNVTSSAKEANSVFKQLSQIAQRDGTSISTLSDAYLKLNVTLTDTVKKQVDVIKFSELLSRGLAASGANAQTSSGVILQLTQGLATDFRAAGQELNSLIEGAPVLANIIAQQLGKDSAVGLKEMAENGELTALAFAKATIEAEKAIKAFEIPATISRSLIRLKNSFLIFVGESENIQSFAARMSQSIDLLAQNFDILVKAILSLSVIIGARLLGSLGTLTAGFLAQRAAMTASAAAVNITNKSLASLSTISISTAQKSTALATSMTAVSGGMSTVSVAALVSSQRVSIFAASTAGLQAALVGLRSVTATLFAAVGGPLGLAVIGTYFAMTNIGQQAAKAQDSINKSMAEFELETFKYAGASDELKKKIRQDTQARISAYTEELKALKLLFNQYQEKNFGGRFLQNLGGKVGIGKGVKEIVLEGAAIESAISQIEDIQKGFDKADAGYAPPASSNKPGKTAEEVAKVTEELKFNIQQLGRTNDQQEIYNNLKQAGVSIDSKAGQEIAALTQQYLAQSQTIEKSKSALQQYGEEARNVTDQLQDMGVRGIKSLEDNLVGLIRGTVSVADAFRSMADQIIDDLIRMQVKQNITGPLSGALDSLLPSIGASLFGGGDFFGGQGSFARMTQTGNANFMGPLQEFASGGSFTVGGVGGPDSQLIPLRLTPGETVNVRKGGQQEQRAPNIIINNNAPQAQVSAGVGANGFDINVMIDDAFANNASRRGTKTFAALNNLGTPLSRG